MSPQAQSKPSVVVYVRCSSCHHLHRYALSHYSAELKQVVQDDWCVVAVCGECSETDTFEVSPAPCQPVR
jgi:RNase P subunit RPR2